MPKHRVALASSIIILLFARLFGTYLMGSNGSDNVLLLFVLTTETLMRRSFVVEEVHATQIDAEHIILHAMHAWRKCGKVYGRHRRAENLLAYLYVCYR